MKTTILKFFRRKKEESHEENEDSFASEHALEIRQKIEGRKKRQKRLKMILGGLVALVLLLSAFTAYSQYKLRTLAKEEQGGSVPVSLKTGDEVIQALSRHILLPSGTPQIAEVQDAEKLKSSQAFFKNAENGDIVVVYDTTIFIYRPSKDLVIAAGDISGNDQIKP